MPYAANGIISTDPITGGISITEAEYLAAIDAAYHGKVISIDGGFHLDEPPEPETPEEPETPSYYIISKMTPWLRMTDAEAVAMRDAMDAAPVRLQEIYKAAPYLQSNDALWPTLREMLTANLSASSADELLARES